MKRSLMPLPAAVCLLVQGASGAEAETPGKPEHRTLDETVVRAEREKRDEGTPTSPSFARAREIAVATPASVGVIASDSYKTGRAAWISDMFQYAPGVVVRPGSGQETFQVMIRGSGAQRVRGSRGIAVTQDGLPLNESDGSFSLEMVDPSAYSRVDVRRGASAWGAGPGSFGGAIDFVDHTGIDGPPVRVSAEGGSYGYVRTSGTGSVRTGAADASATVSASSSDGWRDGTDSRALRVNANVGTALGERGENRLYFGYTQMDSLLPGSLTAAQMSANPRQATMSNILNPSAMDLEWMRLADRVAFRFDDSLISVASGWQGRAMDHPAGPNTSGTGSDDAFFQSKIDYTADVAGHKNRVGAGVYGTFGVNNTRQFVNPPGEARRGAKTQDTDERAQSLALFLDDDFAVTRSFFVTAAVRADVARRHRRINLFNPATLSPSDARTKEYFGVSPMIGARYGFEGGKRQIYANLSRGYEAPTFAEFNTRRVNSAPTVDAQESTTAEIGTRGEAGCLSWDLAAYHSWMRNELVTYNTPTPASPLATSSINGDRTNRTGVEFGTSLDLLGGDLAKPSTKLLWRQATTWMFAAFDGDAQFGDNRMGGVPVLVHRSELLLRFENGFYIGPNLEYTGATFIDNANTLEAGSYVLAGARAGYRPARTGWAAYVEVRNLFDKRYTASTSLVTVAAPGGAYYNPGQGLTASAGIEYTW